MKRTSAKPSNLSEALHQRLNSYALAASAAGVSVLALTQPLEAKIVYTKAHQQIAPNTHYNLDLNHDGITDFTLSNFLNSFGGALRIADISYNAVRAQAHSGTHGFSYYFASAFRAGVQIKANNKKFLPMRATMASSFQTGGGGQWLNAQNRYLGLKFAIQGQTHYGWARLNASCANFQCTELLTGYAYETVANKGIVTGKTKGPDVITVEPASLGHLARGASAMKAWRGTN